MDTDMKSAVSSAAFKGAKEMTSLNMQFRNMTEQHDRATARAKGARAMQRKISFEDAKRQYIYRYTMEHKPAWAETPLREGCYYAPQYRTDREWFDNTIFPGEGPEADKDHCYSSGQTWPLGQWLEEEFKR